MCASRVTVGKVRRIASGLRENDVDVFRSCATYTLPRAHEAYNIAIAQCHNGIPLRWMATRVVLGSRRYLSTFRDQEFEFHPGWKPGSHVQTGGVIQVFPRVPTRTEKALATSLWPALPLACYKFHSSTVRELHKIFGLGRSDAEEEYSVSNFFGRKTVFEIAAKNKSVEMLRVLKRYYGLRREDLVGGDRECLDIGTPCKFFFRGVSSLVGLTQADILRTIYDTVKFCEPENELGDDDSDEDYRVQFIRSVIEGWHKGTKSRDPHLRLLIDR